MRILLHDYAGHAFTVELSRRLAARGHEVLHAYCSSAHSPRGVLQKLPGDAEGFDVRPIDLGEMIPKQSYWQRFRMESAYARLLANACREYRPDVVLSANTPSIPQRRLAGLCRSLDIRHVFWVQDIYGLATYKLLKRRLPLIGHIAGQYFIKLDRESARLSDALVVITEDFKPVFQRWGVPASRIHVVHNWSVLEELPEQPRDNEWSREKGLGAGPRLMYSGTLAMKHNPALLLGLAKMLDQRGQGELIVVSEGAGVDWLQREAAAAGVKSLRTFPYQPFRRMAKVLACGDVLLAILEPEAGAFSVPSKVLSYLCAGRPVLGAMPLENLAARIVIQQNAGAVVPPHDLAGFRRLAAEWLDSPEQRAAAGAAARRYAEDNFDVDRIAQRFEQILQPTPAAPLIAAHA
jgi:glycosyltransferase involved in cell wall biosynthesis